MLALVNAVTLALLLLVACSPARAAPVPAAELALAADMAEAARRFLTSLTPAQARRARIALDDPERTNWHYVPRTRRGVALRELTDAQRPLAYAFLATALSRRGLIKASTIMALEEVLRQRERNPARDPGLYYLSVFGDPSTTSTWGWRLEGHHLSLNLTLVDGTHAISAPAFLGASPSAVGTGFLADTRPLGREAELGFALLDSLDAAGRAQAIHRATAPEDILTGPGAVVGELPGLAAARMAPAQRELLAALIHESLDNLPREQAERERARVTSYGLEAIVFTWAGATKPGAPHYFRLSGPTFLYEYDNTQGNATHVHTVWHARDKAGGDFGVDLLRAHYRQHHGASK